MKNRFHRMEWAGAFGDLGTLIPFVVAYISLLDMDPAGMLLAFGVAKTISGLYYRTPFPVQPMKAIGTIATTQAAKTIVLTPSSVYAAGLVTGALWLFLGATGLTRRIAELVPRPVVVGIVLGLGFAFMLQGIEMMASGWLLSGVALIGTLLLLAGRTIPVMFLLLVFGALAAAVQDPELIQQLAAIRPQLHWPTWHVGQLGWQDMVIGTLFLALPQLPLTLGNAMIAITEENNRLFPDRPVSEQKASISTGIMNLCGPLLGGVPMCHGAGGMAGHVRFGARTGGALIILGVILILVALFLSDSVTTLLRFFPRPVLGVMLFMTGAQLALGSCDFGNTKNDRFVSLTVAAFALWNIGIAFVFGMVVARLLKQGWVRL
ncbi:MAG TPA: molybdate transporter family protein [Salinisphaeraceae bacterium]|nr:molybdate transporter family protein [Salinisphaeraceae bacterium]